jgi:cellulose synthase/poly-beta-1,6-N-acetylglucosamine synthase-like glycosyltransferase
MERLSEIYEKAIDFITDILFLWLEFVYLVSSVLPFGKRKNSPSLLIVGILISEFAVLVPPGGFLSKETLLIIKIVGLFIAFNGVLHSAWS